MLPLQSRIKTTSTVPFRTKRPESAKIIFLSMEGCVTEEEYFRCVSAIFSDIETKIKLSLPILYHMDKWISLYQAIFYVV